MVAAVALVLVTAAEWVCYLPAAAMSVVVVSLRVPVLLLPDPAPGWVQATRPPVRAEAGPAGPVVAARHSTSASPACPRVAEDNLLRGQAAKPSRVRKAVSRVFCSSSASPTSTTSTSIPS